MFQQEFNGYKKSEVDSFIQTMRSSYETKLMAEKFKVLDAEKKMLEMRSQRQEIEFKEQNILNVIERQKRYQEEGSRKISGLIIDKVELLLNELNMKFPQLKKDIEYIEILEELEKTVKSYRATSENTKEITRPVNSDNDAMRMLLTKMQNYKKEQETPKEVRINTKPATNQQKPKATYIPPQAIPANESGFSFEEALNPKDDLEEIMKAFDFYNN